MSETEMNSGDSRGHLAEAKAALKSVVETALSQLASVHPVRDKIAGLSDEELRQLSTDAAELLFMLRKTEKIWVLYIGMHRRLLEAGRAEERRRLTKRRE